MIGRLLYETKNLPDGKYEELVASSERRGVAMEWSFALDALQAERDQAITIDTTRIWFSANGRRYAIIDAPGHRQFIGNMMSGASEADAAILIVDVTEGVSEQTRRHAYLLQLLGIAGVIVAVNKMDAIAFDRTRFDAVAQEAAAHLTSLGVAIRALVPISARHGDNLAQRSERLDWFAGPTILDALADIEPRADARSEALRLRIQDVYREDTKRIAVGRIESGHLAVGETVVISPTGSSALVTSIERWPVSGPPIAHAGESIGFTIDRPIYIERGDVISHLADAPLRASAFSANFFWMDERGPDIGATYRLQFGPTEARVTIASIDRVVDTETLAVRSEASQPQHALFELTLRSSAVVPLDTRDARPRAARCVLLRDDAVVAGGFVTRVGTASITSTNIHPHDHLVSQAERSERNGHRGAVIWLTGLSGSGKSTLAMAVERRLFARGMNVYVLDGDNVRSGLNRDLGFAPADRTENIRRVAEVAALFADAGTIVITAFISPDANDRSAARAAARGAFHEIYLAADLATCEARDPKGLYARARSGEIRDFTGISAPYEVPTDADLVIESSGNLDACITELLTFVVERTTNDDDDRFIRSRS